MAFVEERTKERMVINMGPQHPSTHGVLRLELELEGEIVRALRPHIGYLHTGMEKTAESKKYIQVIPILDRTDYLSPMINNLGYCLAVEKLLDIEVPPRGQFIRVMLCELNRIASHLVWLGTHAMDIGAVSVFLYCFREREKILDLFEEVCGARMTVSYFRIGGLSDDLPEGFTEKVWTFLREFPARLQEYEDLLTKNPIWLKRTRGIGVISAEDAINLGLTGPSLRACGVKWDLRKANPYSGYENFRFFIPTGTHGDVYDRYLVRLEEMRQSREIVRQAIENLPDGPYNADRPDVVPPPKDQEGKLLAYGRDPEIQGPEDMEALIRHFKIWTEGFRPPKGAVYQAVEAPKGELGYYIVSDGSAKPYRMHIRGPSFVNLQALERMCVGHMVADVVAIIASIDPVMGEVDR